jgi:hypothetical protein
MPKTEIPIKCKGNRYLPFSEFVHFQGNLKEMSKVNAEKLKKSIIKHGWIAPVFTWNGNNIIDGHGRLLVLGEMLKNGHSIGDIPVVDIQAKDRKEAAEILLSINSHYQKITGDGLYEFMNDMDLNLEGMSDFVLPDIDLDRFEVEFFISSENKLINEEAMTNTENECPKCGFKW